MLSLAIWKFKFELLSLSPPDFYFSIKYSARLISVMNFIPQINPDFDFMWSAFSPAFGVSGDRKGKKRISNAVAFTIKCNLKYK